MLRIGQTHMTTKFTTIIGSAVLGAALLAGSPADAAHPSDPQSDRKQAQTTARRASTPPVSCPAGSRYVHIQSGGLLFKKTHFKGCADWQAISYYQAEADRADRNRWAAAAAVGNAFQRAGEAMQQSAPRSCTTSFIGSTAYTSCY